MTRPWITLATSPTREGALELRRRGDADYLIVIGGRVLMNSFARSSEEKLATLGLAHLKGGAPRVLIGGLGMGFTLRAALDVLPRRASIVVAELDPVIVEWCRGPLADATRNAVADPRVRIELGDVARVIGAAAPGAFDAIVLDLYEGPNAASQRRDDPFYSPRAIESQRAALAPGGVLAVWSEDPDASYAKRLGAAFAVTTHAIPAGGSSGRKHVVYLATAASPPSDARRRR
jgi:spermidine synthase